MKRISSIILSMIIILPNVILMSMLVPTFIYNKNASAFAGGDGSSGNPFQISNVTELQNMSANLSAHYILINDIDASNTTKWNWNGTIYKGFIPVANDTDPGTVGFQGTNFTGSFDGRGYNITGLFINRTPDEYIGLFGRVNPSAMIKNVNIINYSVFGDNYVGGLIAYNNGGTVTNCNTSGTINIPGDHYSNTEYLGGLIGYNLGLVSNCLTRGDIYNSGQYAGGLIGESDANITNCTSYVNVSGEVNGGGYNAGLIGYNIYGSITNCSAYGNIHGCYDIGGLLGDSWGPVTNCSTYGNVTGAIQYGGLIGMGGSVVSNCRTYGNVISNGLGGMEFASGGLIGSSSATVINCSTYGDIYGYQQVGGLLGLNDDDGKAINCSVYGNTMGKNDSWAVGGLVGENEEGTVTNCIVYGNANSTDSDSWDTGGLVGSNENGKIENSISYAKTSGYEEVGGLIGWSNGEVVNCTAFGNVNGTGDYTGGLIGLNGGEVINCTTYGDMTATGADVGGMVGDNAGTVINCNVYGNMTTTGADVGGMVGWNDNAGTVIDCNVYGDINCIGSGGGLIGFNGGKVINCSVFGIVNGTSYYIGGLIGKNEGIVANCTPSKYVNGTEYLGGLAGFNGGVVSNCTAYSDLNGTHDLGGLIGYNIGKVTNCIAYGNINGTYGIGGLIGLMDNGAVTNCNAFGNVTSLYGYSGNIGGLIGAMNSGTATNCNAFGDVYGTYEPVGGLIGWSCGPVTNCNAYGEVSSTDVFVGGLIGENNDEVTNCNAYGNTTGKNYVGGLLGASYWEVTNSNAYGNTTGNRYVGGLIGLNDWSVTNSHSHGTTMGNSSDSYAVGGLIGFNDGWGEVINCTAYSKTSGNSSVGGLIGFNNGWAVTDCTAYGNTTGNSSVGGLVGNNTKTVNNCTSYGNTTGNTSVGGIIGNNSGTVKNSTSYGNTSGNFNVGGVVGYNNGTVKNCTSFGNVTGTGSDYIGGLIGTNNGTIINSKASGNIKGDFAIGGLIGLNQKTGTVTNCTAFGNVTGLSEVGGLIGNNSGFLFKCNAVSNTTGTGDNIGGLVGSNFGGTISNSSAHGFANGNSNVGGLVGTNNKGLVTDCFSVGNVTGNFFVGGLIGNNSGTVITCFWDNETSGLITSAGGTGAVGKNTTEMMKQVTFTSAGWDFMNIWGLDEGKTYPFFIFLYNPPFIVNEDIVYANEDALYYVDYEAIYSTHVPGNDIDEWNLTTNASSWLTINMNGVLSGTPSNNDVGIYWINVTVFDKYNGNDSHNFTLTVINVNDPPIITTMDIKFTLEDVLYSVDYNATDIDPTKDTLTWRLETNATWLNIDALTGNLTGTPTNDDVGTYFVNVSVDDNKGGIDFTNFTLEVIDTNDPPVIITANIITATEDVPYWIDYEAIDMDPNGDTFNWSLSTNATWLSMDDLTGNLSGIPSNDDVGIYFVNVTVDDNRGGMDFSNFTLTVINTNDPPVIITADILTATEDILYWVDYEAIDIDPTKDSFTWSYETNASWLGFNTITGNLSGTPSNSDLGTYFVNVTVVDGKGGLDFTNFSLKVIDANDPPVIITADVTTATEDILYSVDYDATDLDIPINILTWSYKTNASWLSFSTVTGILSGTPTNDDVGVYFVNVSVDDNRGGLDFSNFTLTVTNTNDAPVIITADILTATEDILYSIEYQGTDVDPTMDLLTWSRATNATWLSIDPSTGLLSGTPNNTHVGTFWINVTVDDGNGGTDSTNFSLTVYNVNDNPIITTTQITKTATEDLLYSVDFDANDIDPTLDVLTWYLTTNAGWLEIEGSTGVIIGTPMNEDVGSYWVNVSVEDGNDGLDHVNFTMTVNNVNDPPFITTMDLEIATEDELYYMDYEGIDIDPTADSLTWSLATDAKWLEINNLTGNLSGIPTNDDVGKYWVNVSVADGNRGIDWSNFTLTVNNVNDPPIITTDAVEVVNATELYSVDYDAVDIDPTNDILTWSLTTNASDWLTIDSNLGVLSGTPSSEDVGNYWVNVTVNDGNSGSNWHYFVLTIISVPISNQNPVIDTTDVTTTFAGELYSVKYQAIDDRTEVEKLEWTLETNATWLSFDTSTDILSGTPTYSDVGTYWINISVDDREGGMAFSNFILKVIKFKPENTKPNLTDGKMTPESGDINTDFIFSVTYTDDDNDPGNVWIWIDGKKHQMEPDLGDIDYTDGIKYFYKTKLDKGRHTYYFTANDGIDEAESRDSNTPTNADNAMSTPKIGEPEEKGLGLGNLILYLFVIIIIIIIVLICMFIYKNKRKMRDQIFEDEKHLEGKNNIGEDSMTKEFLLTEDLEIESYELIKELKQEALIPEQTSEFSLSGQEILERFEIKYSKGEISKATYDSIRESLIKNEL
jgi:hypothetical protein